MISSLEVGSVFRIVDDASPALKLITDQLKLLNEQADAAKEILGSISKTAFAGLDTKIGTVTDSIKGIGDVGATAAEKMTASFDAATVAMSASLSKVAAQIAGLKFEGGAVGGGAPPSVLSRGRFSGGGPGGPHVTTPHVGAGGFGVGGFGGALGVGVAALGYGAFLDAEVQDAAARMFLTGQMKAPEGMTKTALFSTIRDTIQDISTKTGYGPKEVSDAMLGVERQFGGLPLAQRVAVEKTIAPYAAAEARMKEASFGEAFESLVGLTHMTGTYDPEKLPELMRQFSYASMITPASIGSFRNALSYSMPMLHAGLDMNPSSIMFLTAMMQNAGITNSKSGTWLRSFFENAEPRIGTSKTDLAHNEALRRMGMLDANDQVTWQVKGADGKTDWDASILKMSSELNTFTSSTDPAERLGLLRQGFGERGGGFGALMNLPQFVGQFSTLQEKMASFQGGPDVIDFLNQNSPMQQFRLAWTEIQNVLMDLGSNVLPPVVGGLKGLDIVLKDLDAVLKAFPFLSNFMNTSALASNAYAAAQDLTGGQGWNIGSLFGGLSSWWGGGGSSGGGIGPSGMGPGSGGHGGGVGAGAGAGFSTLELDKLASDAVASGSFPDTTAGRAAFIRYQAKKLGIDPDYALSVAKSEGLFAGGKNHQNAQGYNVFGDFQLNYSRGVGVEARKAGIEPEDWQKSDTFALMWMRDHGTDDWAASGHHGPAPKYNGPPPASTSDKAATPPVPGSNGRYPGRPVPGSPWSKTGDDTVFDSNSTDPSIHAHAKELTHVTNLNIDGKRVAQVVQKHVVRRNQFVFGPSGYDGAAIPSGVDHGLASAVAA
jgi:hypothetical protein